MPCVVTVTRRQPGCQSGNPAAMGGRTAGNEIEALTGKQGAGVDEQRSINYHDIKGAGDTSKLDWDSVVSKKGETRLDHINRHSTPNSSRATHDVFNGDPQVVVNQAWNNKGRVVPHQ